MSHEDSQSPLRASIEPTSGRPGGLGIASAIAAVLTWVLQAVAGRALGPDGYASFMVVWGFLFLEIGLLQGLQQEITRAVAADTREPAAGTGTTSPMAVGLRVGAAGGVLVLVSSPVWGARLFGPGWLPVVLATAAAFLAYASYNVANGVLSGRRRWTDYAVSISTDAVLRLALLVPVVLLGAGLGAQAWALVGAAATWVVLLGRRGFRDLLPARVTSSPRTLTRGVLHAMVATGCSAVLVSGFPVLLQLTAHEPLGPRSGVLIAAVVATRAPLLLPLGAFQAVILTSLVLGRDLAGRTLTRLLGLIAAATLLGVAGGSLLGPRLLRLLYGDAFRIDPAVVALLVLAAGLIAAQTLTGSGVMAFGLHTVYAGGWLLSTGVVVVVLLTGLPLESRTVLALLLGSSSGLAVNLVFLVRHVRAAGSA